VNRYVSSRVRKVARDGADVTSGGRRFMGKSKAKRGNHLWTINQSNSQQYGNLYNASVRNNLVVSCNWAGYPMETRLFYALNWRLKLYCERIVQEASGQRWDGWSPRPNSNSQRYTQPTEVCSSLCGHWRSWRTNACSGSVSEERRLQGTLPPRPVTMTTDKVV